MQQNAQILFDGVDRSTALEENIREHIDKLHRFSTHITSCRVSIRREHHQQRNGLNYNVHITLNVPKRELVVNHERQDRPEHQDPYVAVRDAFKVMTRQLEDHERKIRGDVKHHEVRQPPTDHDLDG